MFYKSPTLARMLKVIDPIHTFLLRPHFYKTHSNITFQSWLILPRSFFSSGFPTTIL